jgi:hypothetical protein
LKKIMEIQAAHLSRLGKTVDWSAKSP